MPRRAYSEFPPIRRPLWRRVWRGLRRRLVDAFNRLCRHRNNVYLFDPSLSVPPNPPGVRFERYDQAALVPEHVRQTICQAEGSASFDVDILEIQDNAVYWAAYLDDRVAGTMLSRSAVHFRRWFVPLESQDMVLFRARTLPAFRGRGVYPALMRHMIAQDLRPEGHAYVDCRVYNTPSARGIERAGFRKIATMKPLSRQAALG